MGLINLKSDLSRYEAPGNIRDESFNSSYIKQPYIVRGIQREERKEPQRWGIDSISNLDSGLVRGGVSASAERSAADLERISKWLISPKGIAWTVKQTGLGLSNPRVETATGVLTAPTRIHPGAGILPTILSQHLGLHFTRHQLPFINSIGDYENVQASKQQVWDVPYVGNRLITLHQELFNKPKPLPKINNPLLRTLSNVTRYIAQSNGTLGNPIQSLSGIGGPNSVYGVGFTNISRVVDTRPSGTIQSWNYDNRYGMQFNSTTESELYTLLRGIEERYKSATPGGNNYGSIPKAVVYDIDSNVQSESSTSRANSIPDTKDYGIHRYKTVAYGKIPKRDSTSVNDFRDQLDINSPADASLVGKPKIDRYYVTHDLEGKYGFGKLGIAGSDKTDPNKFLVPSNKFGNSRHILSNDKNFRGDKVNAIDVNLTDNTKRSEIYPDGTTDLIKFYFQDGDYSLNDDINKSVIVFRSTILSLTDSFNPGWEQIDIVGRPDGVWKYNTYSRDISFSFMVAATSRSEMIPLWRKLNYLASYTMPDFNGAEKPSAPFMRLTLGSLFQATPGFISSLTYSVLDDTSWDIAEDRSNYDSKQLPTVVEVSMGYTIIGDYRPQLHGRAYSLSENGKAGRSKGQWLLDAALGGNARNI